MDPFVQHISFIILNVVWVKKLFVSWITLATLHKHNVE